jgi:hypothetical protein
MNKQAVALAADSAVTLSGKRGPKIFASADKIFTLSKYAPVGVMVFDNAEFMRVPWETIIKIYRRHISRRRFDTLGQYADHFIDFLAGNAELFPQSEQQLFLLRHLSSYYEYIREILLERAAKVIKSKGVITDSELENLAEALVREQWKIWDDAEPIPNLPDDHEEAFRRTYGRMVEQERASAFENLPLTEDTVRKLGEIAVNFVSKLVPLRPSGGSGVVVCGFGERDVFPILWNCQLYGVAHGQVHRAPPDVSQITRESDAVLVPFAQREMVDSFMRGIHPDIEEVVYSNISRVIAAYPGLVLRTLGVTKLTAAQRKALDDVRKKMLEDFDDGLDKYKRENHVDPTVNIVAGLPKDELAAMAEALVNLTSFRRRVSMDAETVGGPIDVAVISKGDGFVWIKRKHYFGAELNPQFLATYNL